MFGRLYLCSEGIEGNWFAFKEECFSLWWPFYNFSNKTNSSGLWESFNIIWGHICFLYSFPFTAVSPSTPGLKRLLLWSILWVFFHHSSCPGDTELWVNDEIWWMKILSPLLSDDTDGLTKVRDVLLLCCPLCHFHFTCHHRWNELMLTETPTQTLAAIQLKEKMNADSTSFVF